MAPARKGRFERVKRHVLFVCIHNSARSQMAEAFLNALCPGDFVAESAGLQPGTLNPFAVAAMSEIGIDISGNATKSVSVLLEAGREYSFVITVCDETSAEQCPVFPGGGRRLHWSFADPAAAEGSFDERMDAARRIRDQIRSRVEGWCAEACAPHSSAKL